MGLKESIEAAFDTNFTDTRDNWRSLCPFHLESTPSFYIHKDDLVGHCFGCSMAGRLDILVARYLGTSPATARKQLGLEHLPWLDEKVERYIEPTYPHIWIRAWKRISNHPYLYSRGLSNETVSHFEMRWDPIERRVVWPLTREEGRTVGAVGRATDSREPKYRFYWNCDKGQQVWGAGSFWRQLFTDVIVVEGIIDCMWLWQTGLQNVVTLIGAQATKAQKKSLKEFDRVIIALDNDRAGRNGALDLGNALKGSSDVQYAIFPEACDANDLLPKELNEVFSNLFTPLQMKLLCNS